VGKYECKSEIYMTTNLTVATASGKRRVAFCNLFFSETNNGKWKRSFTTCVLRRNKHAHNVISGWFRPHYAVCGSETLKNAMVFAISNILFKPLVIVTETQKPHTIFFV